MSSNNTHLTALLEREKRRPRAQNVQQPALNLRFELMLAARLIGQSNPTYKAMKGQLSKAWGCHEDDLHIQSRGPFQYYLTFPTTDCRAKALNDGPWHVGSDLLVLAELTDLANLRNIQFTKTKLWVRVHDLPLKGYTKEVAEAVGDFFGGAEDYDLPKLVDAYGNPIHQVSFKEFLRVKTVVDISEALPRRTELEIVVNCDEIEVYPVRFSYEKIPDICYACGILGHKYKDCEHYQGEKPENLPFGEWMKAETFIAKYKDIPYAQVPRKGRNSFQKKGYGSGIASQTRRPTTSYTGPPQLKNQESNLVIANTKTPQPFHPSPTENIPLPSANNHHQQLCNPPHYQLHSQNHHDLQKSSLTAQNLPIDYNTLMQILAALPKTHEVPLNPTPINMAASSVPIRPHALSFAAPQSWYDKVEQLPNSPSPLIHKNLFFHEGFQHTPNHQAANCFSSEGSSASQVDLTTLQAIVSGSNASFSAGPIKPPKAPAPANQPKKRVTPKKQNKYNICNSLVLKDALVQDAVDHDLCNFKKRKQSDEAAIAGPSGLTETEE